MTRRSINAQTFWHQNPIAPRDRGAERSTHTHGESRLEHTLVGQLQRVRSSVLHL